MINILALLFLLLPNGLHWDTVCFTKPGLPNALAEMMFIPHDSFTTHYSMIPPTIVDSMLTHWTRKGADVAGFQCGSANRHYDQRHIDSARNWSTTYEPYLGYFKINIRSLETQSFNLYEVGIEGSLDSRGLGPYINPTEGDT